MRDTKTVVYGSSYDRGLEHLLKMWSDVIKEVPDARLNIFYGWNLYDVASRGNPQMKDWKEKMIELMKQPGVTDLGRISHEAVKVEFEKAGIWAYPTQFGEISCITAMKAQTYGAIPVVVSYAALQETVQYGVKVDGDIYDQETKDEFKKQLISLLQSPERQEEIREPMVKWAEDKFPWSKVAKQWSEEFKGQKSLDTQVDELMEDNQPLKAWDLVKDTDSPLKEKVYTRVKHAFEPETYKKYYENDLVEYPLTEEQALNIDKVYSRFAWVVPRILKNNPTNLIDLGCADGYLCLTVSKNGVRSVGINLYNPSVILANERAEKAKLHARFLNLDLFDYKEKADSVVLMEVLEHLPDPQKGVDHAISLLNNNGHAFFSTPRTDHTGVEQHKAEPGHKKWDEDLTPSGHLRLFTEEEFKELFKNYKIVDFHVDEERCMIAEVTK